MALGVYGFWDTILGTGLERGRGGVPPRREEPKALGDVGVCSGTTRQVTIERASGVLPTAQGPPPSAQIPGPCLPLAAILLSGLRYLSSSLWTKGVT